MIIAQLSDTHVTPDATRADGKPTTQERLRQAAAHVLTLPAQPDVVLVSGDCTDHGASEEVERFRELLQPLPMPIVMHHPPFATGLDVLDQLGLAGADSFGAIVVRHRQVERVVAGHIHCTMQRRFHGTLAMTCTSTALQIRVDHACPRTLHVTNEAPSCLVHTWSDAAGALRSGRHKARRRPIQLRSPPVTHAGRGGGSGRDHPPWTAWRSGRAGFLAPHSSCRASEAHAFRDLVLTHTPPRGFTVLMQNSIRPIQRHSATTLMCMCTCTCMCTPARTPDRAQPRT